MLRILASNLRPLGTCRCPSLRLFCSRAARDTVEDSKLTVARVEASRKFDEGGLNFDPFTATNEQLLEWHTLYSTEREAVKYRADLLKYGRKALRQIRENRIPAGSKWITETPVELLLPTATDQEVIAWYSKIVVEFQEGETSAAEEYRRHQEKPLSETQIKVLNELRQYVTDNMPDTCHIEHLSIAELRLKRAEHIKRLKEQNQLARLEAKKQREEQLRAQKAFNVRNKMACLYKQGKVTEFDYREKDDDFLLEWYENYLAEKQRK